MNDFIAFGAMFGTCIGLLIGYVFKHCQDTKIIGEIQKINDDLIKDLKRNFERREDLYKKEINRLNSLIAKAAADRVIDYPNKAKMTDFVEIALSKDGFEELDFPNGGINGKH